MHAIKISCTACTHSRARTRRLFAAASTPAWGVGGLINSQRQMAAIKLRLRAGSRAQPLAQRDDGGGSDGAGGDGDRDAGDGGGGEDGVACGHSLPQVGSKVTEAGRDSAGLPRSPGAGNTCRTHLRDLQALAPLAFPACQWLPVSWASPGGTVLLQCFHPIYICSRCLYATLNSSVGILYCTHGRTSCFIG